MRATTLLFWGAMLSVAPLYGQSRLSIPDTLNFSYRWSVGIEYEHMVTFLYARYQQARFPTQYFLNARFAPRVGMRAGKAWMLGLQGEYHVTRSSYTEWPEGYGIGIWVRRYWMGQEVMRQIPLRKRVLGIDRLRAHVRPYIELSSWFSDNYMQGDTLIKQPALQYFRFSPTLGANFRLARRLYGDVAVRSHIYMVRNATQNWATFRLGLDWFFR